jgi:hypothetical protein
VSGFNSMSWCRELSPACRPARSLSHLLLNKGCWILTALTNRR